MNSGLFKTLSNGNTQKVSWISSLTIVDWWSYRARSFPLESNQGGQRIVQPLTRRSQTCKKTQSSRQWKRRCIVLEANQGALENCRAELFMQGIQILDHSHAAACAEDTDEYLASWCERKSCQGDCWAKFQKVLLQSKSSFCLTGFRFSTWCFFQFRLQRWTRAWIISQNCLQYPLERELPITFTNLICKRCSTTKFATWIRESKIQTKD